MPAHKVRLLLQSGSIGQGLLGSNPGQMVVKSSPPIGPSIRGGQVSLEEKKLRPQSH